MINAKTTLNGFAEEIEKILIEFSINEERAFKMYNALKDALEKKYTVEEKDKELFDACTYNALATLNTVPGQDKKTSQLLMALTEAKEEIKAIAEYM